MVSRSGNSIFRYVELNSISNFSFLEGGSHPEELVECAAVLGYAGIGIADYFAFSGSVRSHIAAKNIGIGHIVGSRLRVSLSPHACAHDVIIYPTSRDGYGNLSREISTIHRKHQDRVREDRSIGSGQSAPFSVVWSEIEEAVSGSQIIIVPDNRALSSRYVYQRSLLEFTSAVLASHGKNKTTISVHNNLAPEDPYANAQIFKLADHLGGSYAITGGIRYHKKCRKKLTDVLSCIRHKKKISSAGYLLSRNSECYMKPVQFLGRIFKGREGGFERGLFIFEDAIQFNLDQLTYEYPEPLLEGVDSPFDALCERVLFGAGARYPEGVPEKIAKLIEAELSLIKELRYEKYFLVCHDIVEFSRRRGILCQGRGAAANSAVCFCLGITSVDPNQIDTLFARFISRERNEPPDIDIDFEHERRDEVIQYIYSKYGDRYAALVSEIITYRTKSAIRDVAKVFGLSLDAVSQLTKVAHRWKEGHLSDEDVASIGFDPYSPVIQMIRDISYQLVGFPRHFSQHNGGFIISKTPLDEIVPIRNVSMEGRTIVEWNKDDIDALGILKIDILALGMLTCIRKTIDIINTLSPHMVDGKVEPLTLATIPGECSDTYDMICASDTVGVFQIESRAQMSMLSRMNPRCYYDLVIEIAIVRPGPIQGKMVHPYLRRRNGEETFDYPDSRVKEVLGKTLGVPLFQEQAMKLAIDLAGFSPGEADLLRRTMSSWRRNVNLAETFTERIVSGMKEKGYDEIFALQCVNQLKGFSEYGFPESHAASFAHLVYASAWLKNHYMAAFTVGLLNSQPMGFYLPAQLIKAAVSHGVRVYEPDINYSDWDYSIDRDPAHGPIRVGLREIKGLKESQVNLLRTARKACGVFRSVDEVWMSMWRVYESERRVERPQRQTLEALARGDCFRSIGLESREALWQVRRLRVLYAGEKNLEYRRDFTKSLPLMTRDEVISTHYSRIGFSMSGHPVEIVRQRVYSQASEYPFLNPEKLRSSTQLAESALRNFSNVSTIGLIICRQRPGTAKGVAFLTLEDEFGMINITVYPALFERRFVEIAYGGFIFVCGKLERTGSLIYITASDVRMIE